MPRMSLYHISLICIDNPFTFDRTGDFEEEKRIEKEEKAAVEARLRAQALEIERQAATYSIDHKTLVLFAGGAFVDGLDKNHLSKGKSALQELMESNVQLCVSTNSPFYCW